MKATQQVVGRKSEARVVQLAASSMLAVAGLAMVPGASAAGSAVVLCAEPYQQTIAAATVQMWGYRQVAAAADCGVAGATSSPGPVLRVSPSAGDGALEITLVNKLAVPTSIVLAGQRLPSATTGSAPVFATDVYGSTVCTPSAADTTCRVRSFTGETAPGATASYTFSNLRPGTYLYQSGTHPQVQIQMGLFGMVRQDAGAAGILYPGQPYAADVPIVLSEVDPAMHERIHLALGAGGNPALWSAGGSTLNYAPQYFLVNGKVFDNTTSTDLQVGTTAGNPVALRFANAGLQSRSLMLNGGHWRLLSEDGYVYPAPREQYTALLPAGKTHDALMTASGADNTAFAAFFDRRGGTHNADGGALGGQVARLVLNSAAPAENQPPVVNAGPDQTITAVATSLAGTVTDDGRVAPVTTAWSQVGGPPGAATFASPTAPATTASFALPGTYTLRLTANDGGPTLGYDDVVVAVVQPADLSITKTNGVASVNTGAPVTYTITVANVGPSAVAGATVTDTVPAALAGVTWACAASAGSSCGSAGGSGNNINTTVGLAVGGTVTLTVNGTVGLAATGTLTNTAAVAVPAGYVDTNTANNSATDADAIVVVPPTLTSLDIFTRANANTLGGSWSQITLLSAAAIRVNNNQAFCANTGFIQPCGLGGAAYWNGAGNVFGAKQGAAFTIANTTFNGDSLVLKASGFNAAGTVPSTFIRVRVAAAQVIVEATTNGGLTFPTNLATFASTLASSDRLSTVANADGSVDVWRTTAASVSTYLGRSATSTFTGTGRIGMQLPNGARVDDFSGGTVP